MLFGNLRKKVHFGRQTKLVHWHDGFQSKAAAVLSVLHRFYKSTQ